MKLQDRDIDIIKYLEEYKGATINHIAQLFFKGSYEASKKRLKILEDSNYIKGSIHEILNKKVYYLKNSPSFHRLVTNEIRLTLIKHVQLLDFKYEAKIDKYKIDAMAVYKKVNPVILLIEVDIFNRTKEDKIKAIKAAIKQKTKIDPVVLIVSKHKRRGAGATNIINIGVDKISELLQII